MGVQVGGYGVPFVNLASDLVSGQTQTDLGVQFGKNVYPGDSTCRWSSMHAIWHEMSANALLEIVMLADYANYVMKKSVKN